MAAELRPSPFLTLPTEIVHHILLFARTDPDPDPALPSPSAFLSLARVCKAWRAPVAELACLDLDLTALGAPERWLDGPLARHKAGGGRKVPMRSLGLSMEADEGVLRVVLDAGHGLSRLVFTKRDSASIGLSYKILDHSALKDLVHLEFEFDEGRRVTALPASYPFALTSLTLKGWLTWPRPLNATSTHPLTRFTQSSAKTLTHLDLSGMVSFVQSDFEYLLAPLRHCLLSLVLPDNADFPTAELSHLASLTKLATSRPTQLMMDRLPPGLDHLVLLRPIMRTPRMFDLGVIRPHLGRLKRLDVHATLDPPDLALLRRLCPQHNVILNYDPDASFKSAGISLPPPLWIKARQDTHAENRRRRQQGWSHESVARLARAAFAHIKSNAGADLDLDSSRLSPAEINWFLSVLEAGEGEGWRAPLPPPEEEGRVRLERWGTDGAFRRFYEAIRIEYALGGGGRTPLIDEGAFKGLLLWWLETGKLAAWRSVDELIDLHELDFMVDDEGVEFDPIGFPPPPDGETDVEDEGEEDDHSG